jgi:hypothetical protein
MLVIWVIGFVFFARFIPVPSPNQTALQTAEMYAHRHTGIRIGLVLTGLGTVLLAPFLVVVSVQMQRIEGLSSPLAWLQLTMVPLVIVEFIFPVFFMQAAAFRTDRSPEVTQALNDVAWLLFVGVVSTAIVEWLSIGACILQDQRSEPIFPRWFGYQSLFVALSFFSGTVVVFFKTGPLAWGGAIAFYFPIAAFAAWLAAAVPLLLRAVDAQDREDATGHERVSVNVGSAG